MFYTDIRMMALFLLAPYEGGILLNIFCLTKALERPGSWSRYRICKYLFLQIQQNSSSGVNHPDALKPEANKKDI